MNTGVVVVGDVLVDDLVGLERRPGGAGLNLALSVRRLGLRSTLAAPVADDPDGAWLASVARDAGVGLIPLEHRGATGVATSWRVEGEPHYEFSADVHARLYRWDGDREARVSSSGNVLVVNSFPMHELDQADDLAALAGRTGQIFVVDPNVRPALVDDVDAYRQGFRRLTGVAHVVKLSVQDAQELGSDPETLVGELLEQGVRVVLLTRGSAGASLITPAGRVDVPVPDRAEPVVDTMGAGDATLAVLAAGIADDGMDLGQDDWAALATRAMDVAADVCRVPGGILT